MGEGNIRERTGALRRAAGLMVSAAVLCGCSLASSVGSSDDSPSFASRFTSFFSGATPGVTQPHSPTPSAPDVECPGVDIRTGASTMNVAAKVADATAGDLRYQLSFGQTARECTLQGGAMSIKVGVQGRVILGPMGGPGQVGIPLRYAVVREGPQPKTIVTNRSRPRGRQHGSNRRPLSWLLSAQGDHCALACFDRCKHLGVAASRQMVHHGLGRDCNACARELLRKNRSSNLFTCSRK